MTKSKLFLTSIFVLMNILFLNAQTQITTKKDSTTKTMVSVTVFNPSMTKSYFSNQYVDSTNNAIKINPLLIARGDVPIYYERKIAKRFSLEIAAGMTFTDYLYDLDHEDDNNIAGSPNGITVIGKTGYSLEASVRYYVEYNSQAIDGYYVSPDIWYRTYNKNVAILDAYGNTTGEFDNDSRDVLSFQLVVGNQAVNDNALFLDWYVGIGIAKTTLQSVQSSYVSTSTGTINQTIVVPSQNWNPIFSIGLNIGFGF